MSDQNPLNQHQQQSSDFKMEAATEALFLDDSSNSLMTDLNELIKRDPVFSDTLNTKDLGQGFIMNNVSNSGVPIPQMDNNRQSVDLSALSGPTTNASSFGQQPFGSSLGSNPALSPLNASSPSMFTPTPLATVNEITTDISMGQDQQIKTESNDLFDLNNSEMQISSDLKFEDFDVFTNSTSKDVSLGAAFPSSSSGMKLTSTVNSIPMNTTVTHNVVNPQLVTQQQPGIIQQPNLILVQQPVSLPTTVVQSAACSGLFQTEEMLFNTSSVALGSGGATFGTKDMLSSSVPANNASIFNNSPLSDILNDLSTPSGSQQQQQTLVQLQQPQRSPTVSPNLPSHSPSHAGPDRHHSTLHKLLARKDPVSRPSPVRSPEGRNLKTLERMRNSLSASHSGIPSQLSKSAPSNPGPQPVAGTSGGGVWTRREPRQHISSVCSVNDSSIADEVNEALNGLSPTDLPDIESDDEEDITADKDSDDGKFAIEQLNDKTENANQTLNLMIQMIVMMTRMCCQLQKDLQVERRKDSSGSTMSRPKDPKDKRSWWRPRSMIPMCTTTLSTPCSAAMSSYKASSTGKDNVSLWSWPDIDVYNSVAKLAVVMATIWLPILRN